MAMRKDASSALSTPRPADYGSRGGQHTPARPPRKPGRAAHRTAVCCPQAHVWLKPEIPRPQLRTKRGAVLFITFFMMLILTGLALAAGTFSHNSVAGGKSELLDKQVYYIAEAGLQRGRQALAAGTWAATPSPGTAQTESFGGGEYQVTMVDNLDNTYTITSQAYIPSQANTIARRQLQEASVSVTVTNTNLSLAATAAASSVNDSHTANKANDDDLSTYWQAGVNGNGWLSMDYSSATTLDKIVVKEDANITGVSVEWSNDNSSWTTASGLSVVESPSKTWTCTFTAASHRYFRAAVSASSSKKPAVKEMQSYNTASGTVTFSGHGTVTTQW